MEHGKHKICDNFANSRRDLTNRLDMKFASKYIATSVYTRGAHLKFYDGPIFFKWNSKGQDWSVSPIQWLFLSNKHAEFGFAGQIKSFLVTLDFLDNFFTVHTVAVKSNLLIY